MGGFLWYRSALALLPKIDRLGSRRQVAAAFVLCLCLTPCLCQTPARSFLCREGNGVFDAEFLSGVRVHIGAARDGGTATLATRACAAKVSSEKQELVVATGAGELDLDAFGVDLGDGVPVAAFQIKKSDAECCVDYAIYSLEKTPHLLRTITGGEFFSASDRDLDGRVEIWTNDAVAVDGFENLTLGELDSPPTVVFRFVHNQLLDVSAEFASYFDDEIAGLRGWTQAGTHSQDIRDFKDSDGKLGENLTPDSADRLHRLRMAKIKILEIVWAYIYSGREQDAWRSLTEMWPPADVDRIRAAVVKAHGEGIRRQADGTSAGPPKGKKKQARIFDAISRPGASHKLEVTPPAAILLELPPPSEIQPPATAQEAFVDLVIDGAGKVRSAEPSGKVNWIDPERLKSALMWKFIPAFKDGRPVASRVSIAVSPKQ
jgi:hypothetical protein